jgi:hypothetical protein
MSALDDIAALHGDERVWRHRPEGRHTSIEYTRSKIAAMERRWARDGLGYWVARLHQPLAGLPAGACVGVGGCAVESPRGGWNLYYRFRPESHGHGLALQWSGAGKDDDDGAVHLVYADRTLDTQELAALLGRG